MTVELNYRFRKTFLTLCGLAVLAFTLLHDDSFASDTTKVLFIGNSYTYVNDLPSLFDSLSLSGGKIVLADQSTVGGYSLENHTIYQPTLDKIKERNWNYIILQEQSQIPAITYLRYFSMYPAARKLDSLIRLNGSATVFYMTWGRRNGGQQCIDTSCSPVFTNFFHMQDSLKSAYSEIAATLNAVFSPVGEGWRSARLSDPLIELWQSDDSHPSLKGSYLAACVFYLTLFHQSPVGLTYYAGLSSDTAQFLQNAAASLIGIHQISGTVPQKYALWQNYPNPFNPSTKIKFSIPKSSASMLSKVKITVYDVLGREVGVLVNTELAAGMYETDWDGSGYASGVYFYRLIIDGDSESTIQGLTSKMVLMK